MIQLFLSLLRRELEGGLTSEASGNLKLSGNPELCLLFCKPISEQDSLH